MGKSDIEIAVLRHRRARIRELRHRQRINAAPALPAEIIRSMRPEIYKAATKGNIGELEALLGDNEDRVLKEATPQGNTVLHLAAIHGHIQLIELIIAHEQHVVGDWNPIPNNYQGILLRQNSNGDLPLHVAAARGHASVVDAFIAYLRNLPDGLRIVLEERRQVGVRDVWVVQNNEGNTALHLAMKSKCEAVASRLVEVNDRVSFIPNNAQESPLYMAAEAGNLSLVDQMLQNRPAQLEGRSVVHAAVKSKNIEILRRLLHDYPALVDTIDEERRSLLSYIAFVGYDNGIRCLLEGFEDTAYVRDHDGFFPIHSACRKGHLGALREILGLRPDTIELLNRQGQNVLHIAAEYGKNEVVKYFLKNKKYADLINQKDHEGNTPLHLATIFWYPKIVHTLTGDERVNLGEVNNSGFTALDAAEECMDLNPTFRERLTWMALVCVGTPRALILMPHDPALAPEQRGPEEGINQHPEMPDDPALAPGQHGPQEEIIQHLEMPDDPVLAHEQRGPQEGINQHPEMPDNPALEPGQHGPQEEIIQHLEMPDDPVLAHEQRGPQEGINQHPGMPDNPALAPGQCGPQEEVVQHLEMPDDLVLAPEQCEPQEGINQNPEMPDGQALAPGQRGPQEVIIQQLEMPTAKKYKDRVNTLLLLAILVATVAFTAAFSVIRVPEEEKKHWYKPVMLQVFVVSNTIAMYSAVLTTVALIWAQLGDLVLILNVFKFVLPLLGLAFISMSVAFLAGMLVVVGNQVWLPVLLVASGGVFLGTLLVLVIPFICPYTSSPLFFRCVLRFPFWLLMLTVVNDTDDDLE